MSDIALNRMSEKDARHALEACCVSRRWVEGMLAARPFADANALYESSDLAWSRCGEADWLEAFVCHPKFGDVNSLREMYARTSSLAASEQSGMQSASDDQIRRLAEGNAAYEDRFGFIFIVCASGKTAAEMADLLKVRLGHDRVTELAIAAQEQHKITRLRLERLL